jgi:DNA polymerase (family 10)
MASRRSIIEVFERLAFASELLDDPRAQSWGRASWALRNLEGDMKEMRESGALEEVRGIGKGTIVVLDQALAGQRPDALAELEAKLPAGLFDVRRIKGLGPKKVKQLWQELGITSLGELEYACRENRLVDLKGFGKKTQANILSSIADAQKGDGMMRRDRAHALISPYLAALSAHPGVARAIAVGEMRRGTELVRDLAVLIAGDDLEAAIAAAAGARPPEAKIEVHQTSIDRFGTRAIELTGSEEHIAALEARGFDRERAYAEEKDVYDALGLHYVEPERREASAPLIEKGKAAPRLIRREDIRGALHNHTLASDGTATLEQMRAAAEARGLEYLGISEHSHTAFYAKGLDIAQLLAQKETIARMNAEKSACTLLTGVESDILEKGELDYEPDVLAELEVIVASVHKRHAQDAQQMTERMVNAASNPFTAIVGHPTGRLLLGRAPSEYDVGAFLDACARSGCAVELNANPHRLDLHDEHLRMAKERGVLVSIAADAHSMDELDNLKYGIDIARRAGLGPEDVLNTRTLPELRAWLDQKRAKGGAALVR